MGQTRSIARNVKPTSYLQNRALGYSGITTVQTVQNLLLARSSGLPIGNNSSPSKEIFMYDKGKDFSLVGKEICREGIFFKNTTDNLFLKHTSDTDTHFSH